MATEAADAFGRGDFGGAQELASLVLQASDDGEMHVLVGVVHYAEDRFEASRVAWESAYRSFVKDGLARRAARTATLLAELYWDCLGRVATGRGWLERARRLLEELGPCVEWGYWELARMACDRVDVVELAQSADRAIEIAAANGDPALHVRALADSGVALVTSGAVREGLARLDEALACITAGEVTDPMVVGSSFCALLTAAERVGDLDRVAEWNTTIQELLLGPTGGRPMVLASHCSIALGGTMVQAGRWSEAEDLLQRSLADGGPVRATHRVDAVARLAGLRVLQGRIEEAAELLAPYEDHPAVAAPLAAVHLARGEPTLASATAQRAVQQLNGDALRGAPLLMLAVDAALAGSDLAAAAAAVDRLQAVAEMSDHSTLRAMEAIACGRLAHAKGNSSGAVTQFEKALGLLDGDRPDLIAAAHLDLAVTYETADDHDLAVTAARAGHSAAQRLGAQPLRDRAATVLRRLGASVPRGAAERSDLLGRLTAREQEVMEGLRAGETNAQIAARLFLSPKTIEHHVSSVLAKLGAKTRAEAAALAAANSTAGRRADDPSP